jgi:dATP pyrophosphohydrolase
MKDDELGRREPFQVLVLPFRQTLCFTEYAIFQRSDSGIWQGLSGGGEEGESFVQAAQ